MISLSHWGMFEQAGHGVQINIRLPVFDTVLTPDGKTGRDYASEAVIAWARDYPRVTPDDGDCA